MKWYVIPATVTCGLNAMLAAILLSLYSYNLAVDKNTNAPIEPYQEWMHLVRLAVPFCCCWKLLSIFGMYVSMSKKQMWTAALVLILYATLFGIAIYFVVSFGNLVEVDVESEAIYKITLKEIEKKAEDAWIPEWLDNIQKQSKRCCGIKTYRDYEILWASASTRLPRSCCKRPQEDQGPCPDEVTQIPFPNTPTDFFKIETGCIDDIVETARNHAWESYQCCIVMAAFIGCGLMALIVFFTRRYMDKSDDKNPQPQRITVVTGGGDSGEYDEQNVIDTTSRPIYVTSSGEIIGSMDSVEELQPIGFMESIMFPTQMMSAQQQPTMLAGPVFSGPKINRTNVAGLQQFDQQPQQFRASQQQQKLQQFQQIEQQNQQLLQEQVKGQKLQQQYQSPQQMQQLIQQSPQQHSLQMQQQVPPQQQFQQLSSQPQQLTPQQIQQLQLQQLQQLPQQMQQELQQQNQQLQSPLDDSIAGGSFGISFAGKKGHRGRNRDMSVDDNQFPPEQIAQQQTPNKHHRTGMPRTASADNLGTFMQNNQQQQDVPESTPPPGSPTERRKKKVRRDALGNRNNKL